MEQNNRRKANGLALIPFLVFVAVYLITGIMLSRNPEIELGFYQLPAPIAIIIGIIVAFFILEGSLNDKFDQLVEGAGNKNIIIMCIIYILAGAFSNVSKSMGGVDSVVNFGLSVVPSQFMTAGLFIIAMFMSTATGTSVGSIVALGPIAVGVSQAAGLNELMVMGAVVGGSMFGDNLSIISDTTIAATRTQEVEMRDKFRTNLILTLPPAIITLILLLIFGKPVEGGAVEIGAYSIIQILPYLFVLISAVAGLNVFVVLTGGIIFSGIIGLVQGSFGLLEYAQATYDGFVGMFEIFLLSLLMGGLAHMVERAGGIEWILQKMRKVMKNKKSAELGIIGLTFVTDAATANNTVAIITDGPIAREVSEEYRVDPRRTASLLDAASCVMQGLIPYGAQILIAGSFMTALNSPFDLISMCWYQQLLALSLIVSVFVPFANGYINKYPWNFDKWKRQDQVETDNTNNL